MKLQTEIKLKKQDNNQIDYHSKLLLLGSCFSENIGEKFDYFKFQSVSNPFGILFHPKAIENLIVRAIQQKEYSEKDVFFHNEQWHCFDSHSKLSSSKKESLLDALNKNLELTYKQTQEATHIIITLGTAWIYSSVENNKVVANCHKVPQKEFNKRLLTVEEIIESLLTIDKIIKSVNTKTSIIYTVSPVRHVKDGFVENTQSKSHLVSAIHSILSPRSQSRGLSYFPAFEIMLDELRDYRFYKSDMLHPNNIAIEYIWQKFCKVWITIEATKTMDWIDSIQKGLQHKPFNENTDAHKSFLENLNVKIKQLQAKHPKILF